MPFFEPLIQVIGNRPAEIKKIVLSSDFWKWFLALRKNFNDAIQMSLFDVI